MPIITLEGPKLKKEQKEAIIEDFTDVASKIISDIPKEAFVVILKENSDENVGVGGTPLSQLRNRE